ncbi:MAG: class I SAM-dependent methyltransferase [Bacteroidia bacterium]
MKKSWDPVWENVFTNNEWGKYPGESLIQFIARNYYQTKQRSEIKILEVGCGTGANIWYISREGFDAYGIDGSETGISIAKKRLAAEGLKAKLITGDIISLPYEDNFFDCVLDVECLYANDQNNTTVILKEINRILKPGGKFYSRTFSDKMNVGKTNNKISDFEFDSISDGPLEGKGFVRLMNENQLRNLYGAFLKVISVDLLEYTSNDKAYTISELISICEK